MLETSINEVLVKLIADDNNLSTLFIENGIRENVNLEHVVKKPILSTGNFLLSYDTLIYQKAINES